MDYQDKPMPLAEFRKLQRKQKKSKYRNIRQRVDVPPVGERSYHSRAEAAYAVDLGLRYRAKEFKTWEPQFKCAIAAPNGKHLTNYFVDFRIEHHDGTFELVEVKGFSTDVWVLKRRLLETLWLPEHTDHRYTVVRV